MANSLSRSLAVLRKVRRWGDSTRLSSPLKTSVPGHAVSERAFLTKDDQSCGDRTPHILLPSDKQKSCSSKESLKEYQSPINELLQKKNSRATHRRMKYNIYSNIPAYPKYLSRELEQRNHIHSARLMLRLRTFNRG